MSVIAVDIGRSVGICAGVDAVLRSRDLPMDIGAIALEFEALLRSIIYEFSPAVIAWERPFIALRGGALDAQGEIRTQRLYGQMFILHKLAREGGMKTWFDRPNVVRKKALGKGNPSEDEIMAFAHRCGARPANHHEADAYVVWRAAGGAPNVPGGRNSAPDVPGGRGRGRVPA